MNAYSHALSPSMISQTVFNHGYGYPLSIFVNPKNELLDVICICCGGVAQDIYECGCGDVFCSQCMRVFKEKNNGNCPNNKDHDMHISFQNRNKISKLIVYCPNKCGEKIRISNLQGHLDKCTKSCSKTCPVCKKVNVQYIHFMNEVHMKGLLDIISSQKKQLLDINKQLLEISNAKKNRHPRRKRSQVRKSEEFNVRSEAIPSRKNFISRTHSHPVILPSNKKYGSVSRNHSIVDGENKYTSMKRADLNNHVFVDSLDSARLVTISKENSTNSGNSNYSSTLTNHDVTNYSSTLTNHDVTNYSSTLTNHDVASSSSAKKNNDDAQNNRDKDAHGERNDSIDLTMEHKPYFKADFDREKAYALLEFPKVPAYTYLIRKTTTPEPYFDLNHIFVLTYWHGDYKKFQNLKLYRYPGFGWKKNKSNDKFYTSIDELIKNSIPWDKARAYNFKEQI